MSAQWRDYVLGDGEAVQSAEKVVNTSGSVTNARALVDGTGSATLTTVDAADPATVLLDWGILHSGRFTITADSVTPADGATDVALKVSTSETRFGLYRPTTLATQAGEGDTVIKVASTAGLRVGQRIYVGDLTAVVTSVGTAGATGSGVGIDTPVDGTLYARTPVTAGSADQIVGDSGGFGLTSTQTVPVSAAGDVTPTNLYGGFRFQAVQLTTPGTITISSNRLTNAAYAADADDYAGHFLSSDDTLNRAWYSGAYTNAMTMASAEVTGKSMDVMFDGAKRDRGVWSGDIVIQGPVAHQAFGPEASSYYQGSIQDLFANQRPDGRLAGTTWLPFLMYYSDSYSNYTALSAIDYLRYTGDEEFAASLKGQIEAAIAYQATKINERGLVDVVSEPDYWQTPLSGEVSEYNMVYLELLQRASWFEDQLGDSAKAAAYADDATALKQAMLDHLWNDELGAFPLSLDIPTNAATIATDANANALRLGVVPDGRSAALLKTLEGAETPYGIEMTQIAGGSSRADGNGHEVEPLTNYWTVQGRLAAGAEKDGLDLARTYWGQQVDPTGPYYTGTTWEFLDRNGVVLRPADSMAHGWGAGITNVLTEDVLGVAPVDPGYASWEVAPQPGDLTWAQGSVPTADGDTIDVVWQRAASTFDLDLAAPASTSGTVRIPLPSATASVAVNGVTVWAHQEFTPTTGITAASVVDGDLVVTVSRGGTYEFTAAPAVTPPTTKLPSRATLKLRKATVDRGTRAVAIAKVAVRGLANPRGVFLVKEGSKVRARVSLAAGGKRRVVRLPKLAPGRHRLRLVFKDSAQVEASRSEVVVLTVRR
ncbi:alpha-L-rhamnosidase C-terminal domain-containing protein [Nocardioides sp. 1609]|uniref:alpha-L-rhamnosidase C-terminal domain-containing protein n=1 Tax=Nocardioides sp. 1609 TaxID=2508327 RepID=UPI00106F30AF|nr:alpha-L-rhamnosidase C-terminal domain-containing protein [Nocardioides sp. 1609]